MTEQPETTPPAEFSDEMQAVADRFHDFGYRRGHEAGWREGMQTACVVLISKRAKAEGEAAEAEARGYPDMAKLFRLQAQAASEVEQVLRRRMEEGRHGARR